MVGDPMTPAADLKLETEKHGSETIIRATGRITSATSTMLESTLRGLVAVGKAIVLDLSHIDYVDSAGLGALVGVYIHAKKEYCDLVISNPSQRVRDLFNQSGLACVFQDRPQNTQRPVWPSGGPRR